MNNFTYIILWITLFSCNRVHDKVKKNIPNQIVLIIDECPNYSRYKNPETGTISSYELGHEITYRDDDLILHTYNTSKTPTKDTIVFPARSKLIEIEHVYKLYDKLSFIFQKGDTVLFTYENDYPNAQVLNRISNHSEVNYEQVKRRYLLDSTETFDAISQFRYGGRNTYAFKEFIKVLRYRYKKEKFELELMRKHLVKIEVEKSREYRLLDSLIANHQISTTVHDFFKAKSKVEIAFAKFKYAKRKNMASIIKEQAPPKWIFANSDSMIRFGYYQSTLDYLERNDFYSQVPNAKRIAMKMPNYCMVYDLIKDSNQFSETEKKVLLTKNMKLIIENFPSENIEKYFASYQADVNSTALVKHIYKEYKHVLPASITRQFEPNETAVSDSLYQLSLMNRNNERIDLKGILKKYQGKLIYVDFWATTCLPCLMAMPYSGELKIEYEDKKVQFVYISTDKDKVKWTQSEVNKIIIPFQDSYILDHEGENAMLNYFNIKSIPRYMLFDEHGVLLQNSSFGPSTDEIRKLFDKHIPG